MTELAIFQAERSFSISSLNRTGVKEFEKNNGALHILENHYNFPRTELHQIIDEANQIANSKSNSYTEWTFTIITFLGLITFGILILLLFPVYIGLAIWVTFEAPMKFQKVSKELHDHFEKVNEKYGLREKGLRFIFEPKSTIIGYGKHARLIYSLKIVLLAVVNSSQPQIVFIQPTVNNPVQIMTTASATTYYTSTNNRV
ncbi:hypothetical protein ABK040_007411 [Willaertia magna]